MICPHKAPPSSIPSPLPSPLSDSRSLSRSTYLTMSFLKKIKGLDILSTPKAPKNSSVPLPDVDTDAPVYPVSLDTAKEGMGDDEGSTASDRTPSPVTPLRRRRFPSLMSRPSTPKCDSRPSTPLSHPSRPPELIAPTPKWKTAPSLREQGWRNPSPQPEQVRERVRTHSMQHASRPSTARLSERSNSPEMLKEKPRSMTPQVPSRPSTSRWSERSESPEMLKKKVAPLSPKPRRSSSSHPSERAPLRDAGAESPRPPTPGTTRAASRTTARSSRSSSSGQRPLKSILKPTGPTPVDTALLAAQDLPSPSSSPAPVPLPSQSFGLHWQLLPPNPALGKHIRFDVALPVNQIRKIVDRVPLALGARDLDKPAVEGQHLTRMTIRCAQLRHWNIIVKNSRGVTCGDVFDAIHDALNTPLTAAERELYVDERKRARIEEAFAQRCHDAPGLDEYVRKEGLKRVDLLQGKRMFAGLSLSRDDRCDLWEMSIA